MKSNRILMLVISLSVSMAAAFATEETIVTTPQWFVGTSMLEGELNDLCGPSIECRSNVVKFADKVGRIYIVQDLCDGDKKVEAETCANASQVSDFISNQIQ